jgi:hypothetical protein
MIDCRRGTIHRALFYLFILLTNNPELFFTQHSVLIKACPDEIGDLSAVFVVDLSAYGGFIVPIFLFFLFSFNSKLETKLYLFLL